MVMDLFKLWVVVDLEFWVMYMVGFSNFFLVLGFYGVNKCYVFNF